MVASLVELRTLNLSGNQLATLPDLGALVDLVELDVSANQLTQLPATMPPALARLNCNQNRIVELGLEFRPLGRLHELYASDNTLVDIAPPFGSWCPALRQVHLRGNRLEDLPDSFANLRAMELLDARDNQLCIFPLLADLSLIHI